MKDNRETNVYYYIKIGENYLSKLSAKGTIEIAVNIDDAWELDSSDCLNDLDRIKKTINDTVLRLKELNIESKVLMVTERIDVTYSRAIVNFLEGEW